MDFLTTGAGRRSDGESILMHPETTEQNIILEKDSSVQSRILQTLFTRLNETGIDYCVLRNYASLPDSLEGSDLDLLAKPSDAKTILSVLESVVRDFNGKCLCDYAVHACILRYGGFVEGQWWFLPIDLFTHLEFRGLPYLNVTAVLDCSQMKNGVRVASRPDADIITFLKNLLFKGRVQRELIQKAYEAYHSKEQRYEPILREVFEARTVNNLKNLLSEENKAYIVSSLAHRLRKSLLLHSLQKRPLWTLWRRSCNGTKRIRRIFHRPGFWAVVLGVDGSGKSTLLEAVKPVMESALHNRIHQEHIRPHWLPSLARLFGRTETEGPVCDPHASRPSGFFGSLFRLIYYSLDYTIGFWRKVYPVLVKSPSFYVFDRYYYDFFLDPRRVRMSLPKWIIEAIGRIIPEPDLILCLGTQADKIHARKPELPTEEVHKQIVSLKRFCFAHPHAVWIDTGGSIEESADQALMAITNAMASRYQQPIAFPRGDFWAIPFPGFSASPVSLQDAGLAIVSRYAGLPARQPRLFVPLRSPALTYKGVSFYVPGRRRAQLAWAGLGFLVRNGIQKPFFRNVITLCSKRDRLHPKDDLISFLGKRLGYPVADIAMYVGSGSPQRKMTVLAMAANGGQDVVVKIADTESARLALERETKALRQLADSPLAGQAPAIFFEELWHGYLVQAQQKCPFPPNKQIPILTPIHMAFLTKLTKLGRQTLPISQTSVYQGIRDALGSEADWIPSYVQRIAGRVLSDRFSGSPIVCHRTHGDFAPWNLRLYRGQIMAYDWEDTDPRGAAFTDIFHFLFRQAWLVGPWPGAAAILRTMRSAAGSLAERAGIDKTMIDSALLLWALGQHLHAPSNPMLQILHVLEDDFVSKV